MEMKLYNRAKILLIEDDKNFLLTLKEFLEIKGFKVSISSKAGDAINLSRHELYDIFLIDQNLPDLEGIELAKELLSFQPEAAILIITAYPDVKKAVRAMKLGVINYLIKPFAPEELLDEILKTLELKEYKRLRELRNFSLRRERENISIIGDSTGARDIREFIEIAANSPNTPVLLTGETGTGKSLVARAIHYNSLIREKPFLVVNCAAIPESLLEAELFGFEKGAFTGAEKNRKGVFELANGGTLFLDEIGDMPLPMQAKILHVLDSGRIRRIGGEKEIKVKVRIIAATNKNIEELVNRGEFRGDLYYRLAVLRFELPPLRKRREDIIPIAEHFLEQLSMGNHYELSPEDKKALVNYDFPGNVRELRNIIERAVILSRRKGYLSIKELINRSPLRENNSENKSGVPEKLPKIEEIIKEHVQRALKITQGNKTEAAKLLGISLSTLKRWLKKWSN